MDAQNNSVDAFALDMAMTIKKHLKLGTLKVGAPSGRFYEDQPTRDALTKEKNEDHFTVLYPSDGGVKTAEANTAVSIDFWEGKVTHGDSSQSSNLSKSLQQTGKSAIFVLLIRVSKACKMRIDDMGERTISGEFKIKGMPIRRLTLYSVDGTTFEYTVIASTNSKADFIDDSESFPEEKTTVNQTQIAADTHFLDTDIDPTNPPTFLRTVVALSQSGIFSAIYNYSGGSQTVKLNSGGSLVANSLYEFDIAVNVGDKMNFQTSVAGTIQIFRVQESPEV